MRSSTRITEETLPGNGRIVVGRPPSALFQVSRGGESHLQRSLVRIGREIHVASDATVWDGENDRRSYAIILSGVGRCVHFLEDGRRQILRFVFPGDFLSSSSGAVDCALEAVTPLRLVAAPCAGVEHCTAGNPALTTDLRDGLLSEISDLQRHVLLLGQTRAIERLTLFLQWLEDRSGAAASNLTQIPMRRSDIADYLGLTIETVSRVMSRLKREGAIFLPRANEVSLIPSSKPAASSACRAA